MARRAVADSDDEGDDEVFVSATEVTQKSTAASIPGSKHTDGASAIETHEATNAKSTSSTELLKCQMLSAERHLVTNSAPIQMAGNPQDSSPSMRAQKRRHTSAFGSEAVASPEKGAKRTKTLTTYGANETRRIDGESAFYRPRDDAEAPLPKTSQSARFTEHSGYHSSAELPAGSLGEEFANHEPTVLFRDTGSTVPDESSAQQRMIQQALSSKKGLSTSATNELQEEDGKSSSFPWSASEQTRSVKSTGKAKSANIDGPEGGAHLDETNGGGTSETGGSNAAAATPSKGTVASAPIAAEEGIVVQAASRPQASPIVEISQRADRGTRSTRRDSTSTQTSTRNRKRKAEENDDSDPLNSDDKAVGLPKERYQPRPSRRRATQIVEEPIDYSVRPEKAAKTKRTKTTNAEPNSTSMELEQSKTLIAKLKVDVEKTAQTSTQSICLPEHTEKTPNGGNASTPSPVVNEEVAATGNQKQGSIPSQPSEETPQSSDQKSDDHIFVKPSLPTPKPKPASRTRRSRTTVFEDHIEFKASQTSPSLSQQQAKRKSAHEKAKDEGAKLSKRKRKAIVIDEDEDDEDELGKDSDAENEVEDTAPKKRGRGRPAKSKPQAKSAEKILDDSDDGEDDQEDDVELKKRGRGRPAKAALANPSNDTEFNRSTPSIENDDIVKKIVQALGTNKGSAGHSEKPAADAPKPSSIGKENITPSPSPEKRTEKTAKPPQEDAKPSPTLHSPIKSSSVVPYRVGLSNRHRIPSLLKTVKPPTQKN
jgi:hypothetical protein